jgi:hypothetical protein
VQTCKVKSWLGLFPVEPSTYMFAHWIPKVGCLNNVTDIINLEKNLVRKYKNKINKSTVITQIRVKKSLRVTEYYFSNSKGQHLLVNWELHQ